MRLSDFFVCTAVLEAGLALDREEVIDLLLRRLDLAGYLHAEAVPSVHAALLRREQLGSTGIGGGLALPHARHPAVLGPMGVLAVLREGVGFDSLDGEPVHVIALCLGPADDPRQHLGEPPRGPLQMTRWLADGAILRRLREAESSADLVALLREADAAAPPPRSASGERVWQTGTDLERLLDLLGDAGPARRLRLLAAAAVRRVWHLLPNPLSRAAVEMAEAHADGLASAQHLDRARRRAADALRDYPAEAHVFAAHAAVCACLDNPRQAASLAAAHAIHATAEMAARRAPSADPRQARQEARAAEATALCQVAREILGNPFRPPRCDPAWLTWNGGTVPGLAAAIHAEGRYTDLPVLADALEEAGCTDGTLLAHCRGPNLHLRGCWLIDLLTGRTGPGP